MHRFTRLGRGTVIAIAVASGALIAGGASYAAGGFDGHAASTPNRLYACVTSGFSTLNLTTAGATCPNGERKISWNVEGPAGRRGANGKRGQQGDRGPVGRNGTNGINGTNGANGAGGAAGTTGPQGPSGTVGANGTNGTNGTNGSPGLTGPTGPAGADGSTGPTGPTGVLSSAYLDAYTTSPATIAAGSLFTFNTVGQSSGVAVSNSSTTFTPASAGRYLVTVTVGPIDGTVQLLVDGNPIVGSEDVCAGFAAAPCTFSRILDLFAAQAITVKNVNDTTAENDSNGSGITIVRIA